MSLDAAAAGILFSGIAAYAIFGGADFGAGFWDAFAFGPRRDEVREAFFKAMGPVWETNHVWLILVLVTLWTNFPPAFSAIFINLYLPLTVALVGVVFRGAAFAFRHYGYEAGAELPATGLIFSVASIVTPFAMGVAVGAVAGGHIEPDRTPGMFEAWLRPFPLLCGLIGVATSAFLTPFYMLIRSVGALRSDFRRLGFAASVALGSLTALAIPVAMWDAPEFANGLRDPVAMAIIAAAVTFGLLSLLVLWLRRDFLAPLAAAATVVALLAGWASAQYPFVLLPALELEEAAAGSATQEAFLIAMAAGALILVPSLLWLFRLFAGARPEEV
ncbi:MAG: cytochrome d ubiquinol oxidase subunit II [Dehalococcoidia bacterium]|nr:cytochrome d ubiquinol oxidase subunit II [Dehalococcoidia bacterium]